jgi:hypothetical protein
VGTGGGRISGATMEVGGGEGGAREQAAYRVLAVINDCHLTTQSRSRDSSRVSLKYLSHVSLLAGAPHSISKLNARGLMIDFV